MRDESHAQTYREEAGELLNELETALLELEEAPEDSEIVGRIFRAMHTIKGSGAMFGFDAVASFTHEIETVYDQVRNGTIPVTRDLIDLTLKSRDVIRTMLDHDDATDSGVREELVGAFKAFIPGNTPDATPKKPEVPPQHTPVTYRIRVIPSPDLFYSGTNPLLLVEEVLSLGDGRAVAQLDRIPRLETMNPELCYTYWDIILTTDKGINAIRDVFIFVEDLCEVTIEAIEADSEAQARLGEILIERGDLTPTDLNRVLGERKPIGEMLVDKGLITRDKVQSALVEQEHVKTLKEKQQKEESASSIRVGAEKLDRLVDLVGELVTVQARLSEKAGTSDDPELTLIAEEVERLTEMLRDNTMSIRMVPIGTTFARFKRLVRDLSAELGKEIDLTMEGAETELDKTVIERLNDPLVHLIRNAIDHGIETPSLRESMGKPERGMLNLSAKHSGAYVLIEITDDGAGLDPGRIRAKAIEKGLIAPDADLPEKDLFTLLFAPGFSTAEKVTSVSGRGVGMDVVKRTIDSLRGSIDITSEQGTGTTVTLKIPLTLAIIEGLLVTIGEGQFVMPLSVVEECIELARGGANGRRLVNLRGKLVPYVRLRESFAVPGTPPPIEQVVICSNDGHRIGFVVDDVIGEHQTVIKGLGRVYRNVEGISGATILGDGSVALILDVNRLSHGAA